MTFKLRTLKKRADFLRARNGRHWVAQGLILQASRAPFSAKSDEGAAGQRFVIVQSGFKLEAEDKGGARFGFTATKKIGNAVIRNRIKRRLREAVRQIAPQQARKDFEYVLIGRKSTLKRPFRSLLQDLAIAFDKVHGNSGKFSKSRKAGRHKRSRPGAARG